MRTRPAPSELKRNKKNVVNMYNQLAGIDAEQGRCSASTAVDVSKRNDIIIKKRDHQTTTGSVGCETSSVCHHNDDMEQDDCLVEAAAGAAVEGEEAEEADNTHSREGLLAEQDFFSDMNGRPHRVFCEQIMSLTQGNMSLLPSKTAFLFTEASVFDFLF